MFLALSHNAMHANVTDNLFAAIEARNEALVSEAIAAGADSNFKRSSDGHTPKTLAHAQLKARVQNTKPLLALSVGFLALPIAGFMYNKNYAALSLAGIAAGTGLALYCKLTAKQENNFIHKVTKALYLTAVITNASLAGLIATAWASKQWALAGIGTASLAALLYDGEQTVIDYTIYFMVDPEGELLYSHHQKN